jgi:hypothetical protein
MPTYTAMVPIDVYISPGSEQKNSPATNCGVFFSGTCDVNYNANGPQYTCDNWVLTGSICGFQTAVGAQPTPVGTNPNPPNE